MLIEHNYLPVNWVDGMKVSSSHFQQLEDYFIDVVRDANAIGINDHNFGILPPRREGETPLELIINEERIEVKKIRAITRGGARIELLSEDISDLRIPSGKLLQLNEHGNWYLLLRLDIFDRQACGIPDADESPLRPPYKRFKYWLDVTHEKQLNSPESTVFSLPIARISVSTQGLEHDENFIPPCTQIKSLPDLYDRYDSFREKLDSVRTNSQQILSKQSAMGKIGDSALREDGFLLVKRTINYISNTYNRYRLLLPYQAPLYLVCYFADFARNVLTSLDLAMNKENLLHHFQAVFGDFNMPEFNTVLKSLDSVQYNHLDVDKSLELIDDFLIVLDNLFNEINKLSLKELFSRDIIIDRPDRGRRGIDMFKTRKKGITIKNRDKRQEGGGLGGQLEDD